METTKIIGKGENINTALERAKSQVPEGCVIVEKEILSEGKPKRIGAEGETVEKAWLALQSLLPTDCTIIEKRLECESSERTVDVSAFSRQEAEHNTNLEAGEHIINMETLSQGKKGFLGIGRTKNTFRLRLAKKAIVSAKFIEQASIKLVVVDKMMAIQDMIGRLEKINAQWSTFRPLVPSPRELEMKVERDGPMVHMVALNALEANLGQEFAVPLDALLEEAKKLNPNQKEICALEPLDIKPPSGISGLRYPANRISLFNYRIGKVWKRLQDLTDILSREMRS